MQVGEPIWVESLLSDSEYAEQAKKFPSSYTNGPKKIPMFECEFKWRYRMGANIPADEIKVINKRFDEIHKKRAEALKLS